MLRVYPAFITVLACCAATAQVAPTPTVKAQQLDAESTRVFSSLQTKIKSLSQASRQNVANSIKNLSGARRTSETYVFNLGRMDWLNVDPKNLTLGQKMQGIKIMIDASQERVQQVVDPRIVAQPPAQGALAALAKALNAFAGSNTKVLSVADLAPIFDKAQSIGRVLWTYQDLLDKGDPMWQLAGTGFVSSPGIVTTACHVISKIADVSAGQTTIRSGVVVRMDFSNGLSYQKLIPVTKIIAMSQTPGCDAGQLALEGGADLVPLRVAKAGSATKRVLVVGYPLLNNYNLADCSHTGDDVTETQFCKFRKSNPQISKVISPGMLLTPCCTNDHGGISVFTYNAPTDDGQSGSPVFDADTLEVIGIHYCCTGNIPSGTLISCATWHPQNIKWNEAISTQSLLSDASLKGNFSDVLASVTPLQLRRNGPTSTANALLLVKRSPR